MVCFHVTLVSLIIGLILRETWISNIVICNSIVGFLYMVLERKSIKEKMPCNHLKKHVKTLNDTKVIAINVVTHVLIPTVILMKTRKSKESTTVNLTKSILYLIIYMLLVNVNEAYPTDTLKLEAYVILYGICLATVYATQEEEEQREVAPI